MTDPTLPVLQTHHISILLEANIGFIICHHQCCKLWEDIHSSKEEKNAPACPLSDLPSCMGVRDWPNACCPDARRQFFRCAAAGCSCGELEADEEGPIGLASWGVDERGPEPRRTGLEGPADPGELGLTFTA